MAIIMDGNRRWARCRGLPAGAGHRAGVDNAVRIVRACRDQTFTHLTLFAFASANWRRSRAEVDHLFALAGDALERLSGECAGHGLRIELIGRRDRLPRRLLRALDDAVDATAAGRRRLRIALDYSSRETILDAARATGRDEDLAAFERRVSGAAPPVDLLIRTGGEHRLSDFLLWECAFAELYFSDLHWPDFGPAALHAALAWYSRRDRRYGS